MFKCILHCRWASYFPIQCFSRPIQLHSVVLNWRRFTFPYHFLRVDVFVVLCAQPPQHTTLNLNKFMKSSAFAVQAKGNYLTSGPALSAALKLSLVARQCHTVYIISIRKITHAVWEAASQNTTCQSFITDKVLSAHSFCYRDKVSLRRMCMLSFFGRSNFGIGHTILRLRPYESVHKLID